MKARNVVSTILGIVKQRLATAIDTREESQQLGIIRLTLHRTEF